MRLGAAHTCCYAALTAKEVTSGRYQLGNPIKESPAGNRVVSRGSMSRAPWTVRGGGSVGCVAPSKRAREYAAKVHVPLA